MNAAGFHDLRDTPVSAKRLKPLTDALARIGERGEPYLFSSPGRCEICGNHTDHNGGLAVAAAVDLDILAAVRPRADGVIRVLSLGIGDDTVPPEDAATPVPEDFFTSRALIRGVRRAFLDAGWRVGGFDAVTGSTIPQGGGLSSSAAFEVLLGTVLSHLYNNGRVPPEELARIAHRAENEFFGKPCGRMDQLAVAVGGMQAMDFRDPQNPALTPLSYAPEADGLSLFLTDTGSSHADLNAEYAAVPAEMKAVAAALGHRVLREASREELLAALPRVREVTGDRAVLRALHFFDENERVEALVQALRAGGENAGATFARCLTESGRSSLCWLQNVSVPAHPERQSLTLALATAERLLSGTGGSWRIHGGGFAGSVLAFVPESLADAYRLENDRIFGAGACRLLRIRQVGAVRLS